MLGEMTGEEIERVLHGQLVGRLGIHHGGRTLVVPVSYVYDGNAVYVHSYEGEKLKMMRANPEVCFEVDHVVRLAQWSSVITWGRYEELTGDLATSAMNLLASRLHQEIPSETAGSTGPHGHERGVAFRILITEKTGRFETPS